MPLLKNIAVWVLGIALALSNYSFSQENLIGDYVWSNKKASGAMVLKLKSDSTYKFYHTHGMNTDTGKWKLKKGNIVLITGVSKKQKVFFIKRTADEYNVILHRNAFLRSKKKEYFRKGRSETP